MLALQHSGSQKIPVGKEPKRGVFAPANFETEAKEEG